MVERWHHCRPVTCAKELKEVCFHLCCLRANSPSWCLRSRHARWGRSPHWSSVCPWSRVRCQLQLWGLGAAIKQVSTNAGESGSGWELGAALCGHPIIHLFKESSWKVLESLWHHGPPLPSPSSFSILLGNSHWKGCQQQEKKLIHRFSGHLILTRYPSHTQGVL